MFIENKAPNSTRASKQILSKPYTKACHPRKKQKQKGKLEVPKKSLQLEKDTFCLDSAQFRHLLESLKFVSIFIPCNFWYKGNIPEIIMVKTLTR